LSIRSEAISHCARVTPSRRTLQRVDYKDTSMFRRAGPTRSSIGPRLAFDRSQVSLRPRGLLLPVAFALCKLITTLNFLRTWSNVCDFLNPVCKTFCQSCSDLTVAFTVKTAVCRAILQYVLITIRCSPQHSKGGRAQTRYRWS
jgi:hypothetical protein